VCSPFAPPTYVLSELVLDHGMAEVDTQGEAQGTSAAAGSYGWRQRSGLFLGLALFGALLASPPPENLPLAGMHVAAVAILMAVWWITEAIPIPATALLPLLLFPVLGVDTVKDAAAPYAHPLIFLFLGGFMMALAMQRWGLHRRIALQIIRKMGTQPSSLIAGFMLSAAFLSMWVSNTATAMMMLPIGLSVIELACEGDATPGGEDPFAIALLLAIAYSCSIGGLGTLIGTPPNAFMAAFLSQTYGIEIGFAQWMMVGVPIVVIALPLAFLTLTRIAFRLRGRRLSGGRELISRELEAIGPMSRAEKMVAGVFALTAGCWILRPLLDRWIVGLSDAGIAIAAAILLFLLPLDLRRGVFLLNWDWARRVPWDVLLLFGGGLSLATAIQGSGLATWTAHGLEGLSTWPTPLIVVAAAGLIIVLTEFTSNTATAAAFLPILASVAVGIGKAPLLLVVPAALAASCAFMLPVATPPNAIVYGSGRLTIPQMLRAGILLEIALIGVVTALTFTLVPLVFGVGTG
jgi:sodium-dependent dicarboxylate transporter 2/3/5